MTVSTAVDAPDLAANQEGQNREDEYLSTRTLTAGARRIADELGLHVSGSRLRKLVRGFVRDGRTSADAIAWGLRDACGVVDTTGQWAVRNVLRERVNAR